MKKILFGLFALLFGFSLWNCEKDDICEQGTPTTPRLIVEFYDNGNPSVKKAVTNLALSNAAVTDTLVFNGVSKIQVPLKTNDQSVVYHLTYDYHNTTPSLINTDEVTLNYTHNDIFISRACGYKTVYKLNDNPNGMVLTTDASNWIKEINIQKFVLENENETHVKIYF